MNKKPKTQKEIRRASEALARSESVNRLLKATDTRLDEMADALNEWRIIAFMSVLVALGSVVYALHTKF